MSHGMNFKCRSILRWCQLLQYRVPMQRLFFIPFLLQTRPNMLLTKESKVICQVKNLTKFGEIPQIMQKGMLQYNVFSGFHWKARNLPFQAGHWIWHKYGIKQSCLEGNLIFNFLYNVLRAPLKLYVKGWRSESRQGRHHAPWLARLQHCGRGRESCPGEISCCSHWGTFSVTRHSRSVVVHLLTW